MEGRYKKERVVLCKKQKNIINQKQRVVSSKCTEFIIFFIFFFLSFFLS